MNHLQSLAGDERRIPSVVAWRAVRSEIQQAFESVRHLNDGHLVVSASLPAKVPVSTAFARCCRWSLQVAGAFPAPHVRTPRCPLAPETQEEVDCGSYVRRLISYAAVEGGRTPAYLCIPKQCLEEPPVRCPAVLCLHGTDNEVGHGTVVGLSNKENRSYASELADRGFVTIAPSYPLLANYQLEPSDLGFDSGTMMAIWDNVRALDLLDSLPFVAHQTPARHQNRNGTDLPLDYYEFGNTDDPNSFQPGKYGVIGHSLGGHNSVYTALFEPRIAAVVSSCGLDSYRDYMDGNVAGWTQTRYLPKLPLDIDKIPFVRSLLNRSSLPKQSTLCLYPAFSSLALLLRTFTTSSLQWPLDRACLSHHFTIPTSSGTAWMR
jgi:pimeloyl-ACP methyl ester carboxylesterase